jgi:DNA mismatch repair protein MSH5
MQGRGGRGKEGLSLFGKSERHLRTIQSRLIFIKKGIMNSTSTPLGARMLKQWFLRPSTSIEVIGARHDAIAVFLHDENAQNRKNIAHHLKKVKNIPNMIGQMRRGGCNGKIGSEWSGLMQFAFNVLRIRMAMRELKGGRHLHIFEKA